MADRCPASAVFRAEIIEYGRGKIETEIECGRDRRKGESSRREERGKKTND